jgi:hypothetical protein
VLGAMPELGVSDFWDVSPGLEKGDGPWLKMGDAGVDNAVGVVSLSVAAAQDLGLGLVVFQEHAACLEVSEVRLDLDEVLVPYPLDCMLF